MMRQKPCDGRLPIREPSAVQFISEPVPVKSGGTEFHAFVHSVKTAVAVVQ
jgi:hypothetical protein